MLSSGLHGYLYSCAYDIPMHGHTHHFFKKEIFVKKLWRACSAPSSEEAGAREPTLTPALAPSCAGILWNLSSSDHLKDRLARDTLEQLTDLVLSPLSGAGGPPLIQQNASEAEIFYNATGFLRCVKLRHWARRCWGQGARCQRRIRETPKRSMFICHLIDKKS